MRQRHENPDEDEVNVKARSLLAGPESPFVVGNELGGGIEVVDFVVDDPYLTYCFKPKVI